MQNNHIYVEDSGKGSITVYDDEARIKPEKKFYYTEPAVRATARRDAERFAASEAARLRCGWGCNYQGRIG